MQELIESGRLIDLILIATVLEGIALIIFNWKTKKGIPPRPLIFNLLAGFCLLLALRAVLADAWWGWIALSLFAALLAHLLDLQQRWRNH